LGVIFSKIRAVTIDFNGHLFHWRVYFDGEPTDNEKKLLSMACTEVFACLPPDIIGDPSFFCNEEYINLPYPEKLNMLKECVYLRYEDSIVK